jgi:hypothetical protein
LISAACGRITGVKSACAGIIAYNTGVITSRHRIAIIIGAEAVVIADYRLVNTTGKHIAIVNCAGVVIIAINQHVETAVLLMATVGSACIEIITQRIIHANACHAIVKRTYVAIIGAGGFMNAVTVIAVIKRASAIVIAINWIIHTA